MLSLFEGGDPSTAPREGLKVTTIVDRGLKEAQHLKQEPEVQAELYQTLGRNLREARQLAEGGFVAERRVGAAQIAVRS